MKQPVGFHAWACLTSASLILPDTEKVVTPRLASRNLLPTHAGDIDDTHGLRMAPTLLFGRPRPHLVSIDVLIPIMRASGHHPHNVLGGHDCREPARPCPAHCTQDQPAAGLDMSEAICEKWRWTFNVFDDFKQSQHIDALFGCGWCREVLNGRVDVAEAARFE